MAITETPMVKYYDAESNPTQNGDGGEIPVIIGISGNATPASGIQKFKKYSECNATVANGGLGTSTTDNPLLAFLKDFFEENEKINSDDRSVPYVYVIDLGTLTTNTTEGANPETTLTVTPWTTAMELAKIKREVTAEVFVGLPKTYINDSIGIMQSAAESIKADSVYGNPRIAYFTIDGCTDTELKALTGTGEHKIQKTRVGLIEPLKFGKHVANILNTPATEEPGYSTFRTIEPGIFTERTKTEEDDLQNAGIIFGRDERAGPYIYPKICLGVSTSFSAVPDARPNDTLLHYRRNVDQLIRESYVLIYEQLKRNETETNFEYLQEDLNLLVADKIRDGVMKTGTYIELVEDEVDPYDLQVQGVGIPVNSTIKIGFSFYIEKPKIISGGE